MLREYYTALYRLYYYILVHSVYTYMDFYLRADEI